MQACICICIHIVSVSENICICISFCTCQVGDSRERFVILERSCNHFTLLCKDRGDKVYLFLLQWKSPLNLLQGQLTFCKSFARSGAPKLTFYHSSAGDWSVEVWGALWEDPAAVAPPSSSVEGLPVWRSPAGHHCMITIHCMIDARR